MRSMFVGVQVAVEREGCMVRVCLVILYLQRRDSLQPSAFHGSLTLHLLISHFSRESFIKALGGMCVRLTSLTFCRGASVAREQQHNCCGASVASEQQHNQDLRRIYKKGYEFSNS